MGCRRALPTAALLAFSAFSFALCLNAADPAALLRESVAAAEANRERAKNWLWKESIHTYRYDPAGNVQLERQTDYEVVILEGELFHKPVAFNGQPLTPEQQLAQDRLIEKAIATARERRLLREQGREPKQKPRKSGRQGFGGRKMLEYHLLAYEGTATIRGRLAHIVSGTPRPGLKPVDDIDEGLRVCQAKVWIDAETKHALRMDVEQLQDWLKLPAGRTIRFDWQQVEDAWLIQRIESRWKTNQGRDQVVSEQRYSEYRRFGSDVKITVDEVQP